MTYFFSEIVDMDFDDALNRIKDELDKEGFGIHMEMDVTDIFKRQLDVDFRRYTILGACNPPICRRALRADENIGLLLPSHVVVQEFDSGEVQIAVIDPKASMLAAENSDIELITGEIRDKMMHIISNLCSD